MNQTTISLRSEQVAGMNDWLTKMYVKANDWQRGRTRTDYALILSAVAVVVFATYQTMRVCMPDFGSAVDAWLY